MRSIIRTTVGIYEIVGGVAGIAIIVSLAWRNHTVPTWMLAFLGLNLVGAFAGAMLLKKQTLGWLLSLIVQVLQVPRLGLAHLIYAYAAGAGAWIMFSGDGIWFDSTLGAMHSYAQSSTAESGSSPSMLPIGVNLVAALMVTLLLSMRAKRRK
jgi:hypothetical protein